ncbi:MAG: hypothetical protein ABI480_16575, partial [Chitinophagaceae bacterium]
DEIIKVQYFIGGRGTNRLLIVDSNFESYNYPADSLRKRDWKSLKEELKKYDLDLYLYWFDK